MHSLALVYVGRAGLCDRGWCMVKGWCICVSKVSGVSFIP